MSACPLGSLRLPLVLLSALSPNACSGLICKPEGIWFTSFNYIITELQQGSVGKRNIHVPNGSVSKLETMHIVSGMLSLSDSIPKSLHVIPQMWFLARTNNCLHSAAKASTSRQGQNGQ